MKNFINISDIDKKDLRKIIDQAKLQKEKRFNLNKPARDSKLPLENKILIMIFEKPSTRTRLSFEIAMKQLGGQLLVLNPKESHYGSENESIYDTAKVLYPGELLDIKSDHLEPFEREVSVDPRCDSPIRW